MLNGWPLLTMRRSIPFSSVRWSVLLNSHSRSQVAMSNAEKSNRLKLFFKLGFCLLASLFFIALKLGRCRMFNNHPELLLTSKSWVTNKVHGQKQHLCDVLLEFLDVNTCIFTANYTVLLTTSVYKIYAESITDS